MNNCIGYHFTFWTFGKQSNPINHQNNQNHTDYEKEPYSISLFHYVFISSSANQRFFRFDSTVRTVPKFQT
ncbi:hypothetical protein [Myroides sp.]|uniref:hypothetical protein n=1 Tax=Myroides sp. TaxID=1874736 RepID=UPI003F67D74C